MGLASSKGKEEWSTKVSLYFKGETLIKKILKDGTYVQHPREKETVTRR